MAEKIDTSSVTYVRELKDGKRVKKQSKTVLARDIGRRTALEADGWTLEGAVPDVNKAKKV